jgi:hypothetical protein
MIMAFKTFSLLSYYMKLEMRWLAYACIITAWVVPRILPLLLYPGVYSFDAWLHIGYTEGILAQNQIPFEYGSQYPYFYVPFMHLFAILIQFYFGLPLIECFRILAAILVLAGFLTFFALFRSILGKGWASIVAMLLFSVDVDVVAQTNCAIPENFALVFLALILLISLKLVTQRESRWQLMIASFLLLPTLVLGHHLTSYFAILFALSLFVASIASQNKPIQRIGAIVGLSFTIGIFALFISTNPRLRYFFSGYYPVIIIGLASLFLCGFFIHLIRNRLWRWLEILRSVWAKRIFPVLGFIIGIGFFTVTLLFYPYDRSWQWLILKFGFFSCLLGLSVAVLNLMPWADNKTGFIGLCFAVSIILIGVSFIYSASLSLVHVALSYDTLELSIGHRHFTFFIIPFAIISTIALTRLVDKHKQWKGSHRIILPGIALLLITFSAGGIYNLYVPAGGWYPEWGNQAEIDSALWLQSTADYPSVIISDGRFNTIMNAMYPRGTNLLQFQQMNSSILEDPSTIQEIFPASEAAMYFMTSEFMESHFILEFLTYPITLDVSAYLDKETAVAKVFSNSAASIYWLIK